MRIDRFEVQGNSLLSAAAMEQVLGQPPAQASLTQLQALAQRLQNAYREAGYGAVVVLLPEQSLQDRVLRLQVVEGKLSIVNVTGQSHFSRNNVLRSLPALRIGQTPSLADLDRELLLANDNPLKTSRVVLQPGTDPSEVEALITVEERPLLPWLLSLDNSGVPGTGRYRASVLYQQPNVADKDIVWGLRAMTSPTQPSKVAALGSSLRLPLYDAKTMLEATLLASNTRSDANVTPAGDLRFSGSGFSLGARAIWMLPSLGEYKSQLAAGVDARQYRSKCSLGDFGPDGCGPTANNRLHALPLTLSYNLSKLGAYALNVEWVHNLPWGAAGKDADYDASRPGARASYQLLRAQSQWLYRPGTHWQLNWRVNAQWAPRALVAAEQFGLGGAQSVRGYEERELIGDSGLSSALELGTRLDTLLTDKANALWPTLALFVDAGQLSNRLGTECRLNSHRCSIWSAGLGASWSLAGRSQLRLDAARAGRSLSDTQRGHWKAHLSFSYAM